MSQTAECIIVGGGVMGASIAYHLARQQSGRVVLLERRALGSGTTAHSGAIIRQHYSNDFTIRIAMQSLHVFQHFAEVIGGDCGFTTTGMLVLADEAESAVLRANVALQQQQGVDTRLISPQEIGEVAPEYSSEGVALACYESDAGVADPMATTHSFARRARDYGASLYEGIAVTRILTQGERVTGVETSQGIFSAPVVVLAANVWSVPLAQALGIALPIKATRHPMLALRRPDDFGGRTGMHAVCLDMVRNIYLRPDVGGITLVGSTEDVLAASDPDQYLQSLTQEEIARFQSVASETLPPLARAVSRGGWAGIYDDSVDNHPILGKLEQYEGMYCAVGFSGHGFKLSPSIGQGMAQLITTGQALDDLLPFAYERFARGETLRPHYPSRVLG